MLQTKKPENVFSYFRETTCNMAKNFYCYVFEMTTERIVSSYVINERNKKGGGGGNELVSYW